MARGSSLVRPRSWSTGEIFQLIRQTPDTSRAKLVSQTGLAASTITARVEQLVAAGLVTQGSNNRGGRNPRSLMLNTEFGIVAAVDIGARHVKVGLLDVLGSVLCVQDHKTEVREIEKFIPWLETAILDLLTQLPQQRDLLGVGLSVPAPVDSRTGRVMGPTRVPVWKDQDLCGPLELEMGVPVWMDNDATLMGLAEHRLHYPELDSMLLIKLGSGIGCGIISAGEVYRGSTGGAGDIGHVSVRVPFARPCLCGRSDCLEASIGGNALIEELRARGTEVADIDEFARLAQMGHPDATELARVAGQALGEALAILVNFYNPSLIAVGGALSRVERLYASLLGTLYERALPIGTHELSIEVAKNGANSGICGAGYLVLDNILGTESVDNLVQFDEPVQATSSLPKR